jgi:drug/metabolite transporter (DMT)-like permease
MALSPRVRADGFLLLATIAWGMTFPLIKEGMQFVSPSIFVTLRFSLAAFILFPFLCRALIKADTKTFLFGCLLGAINSCIYVTQAMGMETIEPAEGAFITGINVIFVPLLLPFFKIGKPKIKDFFCSLICLMGIFVLTNAGLTHLKAGVFWVAFSAFFVALSILFLQKFSQASKHVDALAFFQILTTIVLISPWTLYASNGRSYQAAFHLSPLLAIGFCAIFATSFALLIQTRYQRMTSPSRAALIFALEPVFATFFSYFISQEIISWRVFLGGGFVLVSILLSELWGRHKK